MDRRGDVGVFFFVESRLFFYFYFSIEPSPFFFSFLFPPGAGSRASKLQIKE